MGRQVDWTRLGSSFNWAVMAGFRVREKGVCLFLPGGGRREAVVVC